MAGSIKFLIAATFTAFATTASAGNYATCVLDRAPGVQNDVTAYQVNRACLEQYPAGLQAVAQGSGRGWFSYKSGSDCASTLGAKTPSAVAGRSITMACRRLYDDSAPANLFDRFDAAS